jgi:hypothetical protein
MRNRGRRGMRFARRRRMRLLPASRPAVPQRTRGAHSTVKRLADIYFDEATSNSGTDMARVRGNLRSARTVGRMNHAETFSAAPRRFPSRGLALPGQPSSLAAQADEMVSLPASVKGKRKRHKIKRKRHKIM